MSNHPVMQHAKWSVTEPGKSFVTGGPTFDGNIHVLVAVTANCSVTPAMWTPEFIEHTKLELEKHVLRTIYGHLRPQLAEMRALTHRLAASSDYQRIEAYQKASKALSALEELIGPY